MLGGTNPSAGTRFSNINMDPVGYFAKGDGSIEDKCHLLPAESIEVGAEEKSGDKASTCVEVPKPKENQKLNGYNEDHGSKPTQQQLSSEVERSFVRLYSEIVSMVEEIATQSKGCSPMLNPKILIGGTIVLAILILGIIAIATTHIHGRVPAGTFDLVNSEKSINVNIRQAL